MNITDEMVERALSASVDLIQGFTYQERHVIRDFRKDCAQGVEIWAAPIGNHNEMMKRIEFLRMQATLEAAISASPPKQPATDPSVEQRAHLHDAERIPQYPSGCLHPADCQKLGMCQSMSCKHAGKVIVKRVCVEPKEAGIVYPKVEAS